MYGQGNYTPHFRQGPPQFQQGPSPSPFQQGPSPPPVNHRGPSAPPSHLVPPGHPHIYHHGPPNPSPVQQAGPHAMVNTGQSYLHSSPSSYISSTMPPPNVATQQNTQFSSPLPPPPGTAPSGPPPPRVLPPPPTQGPVLYRPLRPPPPPPSITQGIQHGRPLPPPPPTGFIPVTPAPFASAVNTSFEKAQPPSMPPPPPPPPPSSPPPIPPSPPPCIPSPDISVRSSITSSVIGVAFEVSNHMESGSCTDKVSQSVERAIVSVDKGVGPTQTSYGLPIYDDYTQAGLPLSPPPRPAEKEIVWQIEILCQHIVKNGPDFEIIVREKEIGNPRFAFLFGGDPGSDTAIAHQFFQWTKRKCLLESKLHNGSQQSNSLARHPETDSSFSPKNHTNDASHSPADSDMDMEDDIKHADRAQLNVELIKSPISMLNESVHVRELQRDCQCSTEDLTATDASSRLSFHQLPEEKREHGNVPSMVSAEAAEFTRGCTTQELPRSCREDARLTRASPIAAQTSCKVQEPLKGGSPFRLIQGYASDDSSEAEDGPSFEDVSPVRVVESTARNITCLQEDGCSNLDANISLENISVNETAEQGLVSATSMACRTPDISSETLTIETIASGPLVAFTKTSELQNDYNDKSETFIDPSCKDVLKGGDHVDTSGKCQSDIAKQDSAAPEVDEFGRLIRKDATDSDSDAERYNGRRARRGPSRSPQDRWRKRSRSPRRRKDKRNRSSSWSPRKRRSRSKSPVAYRHGGEHGGEKMRRDKDQIPDCFDFLRGRCYRGASCRYLHHGSNTSDMDRRYKGRQHHVDVSRDSRDFSVHGDSRSSGDTHETIPVKLSVTEQDMEKDGKSVEMLSEDLFVRSTDVPSNVVTAERIDSDPALMKKPPDFSIEVDQSPATLISEVCRSESQVRSALNLEKQQVDLAQREVNVPEHDSASEHLEETDKHLLAVTSPIQPISNAESHGQTSPSEHSLGEINSPLGKSPQPSQISKVSQAGQDQIAANHPLPFELPPPLPPQVVNAQGSQPPSDCYLPSVPTNVLSQSALVEPPSHVPLHDEYSQSSVSQHSWTSLPPPPSPPPPPPPPPPSYAYGLPSTSVMHTPSFQPLQFPQNNVPLVRPYSHGVPSHSQAANFHHQTHPAADNLHQPPFHTEVTGEKRLHTDNMTNQPFGVPNYFKDERFKPPAISEGNQFNPGPHHDSSMHPRPHVREEHYPPLHVQNNVQNFQPLSDQRFASQFPGLAPTSSFAQDSIHSQPVQMQSFPDGNFLQRSYSREDYGNLSGENLPFTQRQQSPFGTQWSAADSFPTHMDPPRNANPSAARYQSSFLDTKQSHPSVLEGSKIPNSTHYNPFASAFDQPPGSSKFSSSFSHEIETKHSSGYDSFGVNQDSFGGHNIGDFGSRQMTSDSNRLSGMILPTAQSQFHRGSTGNDQYDPLFDSIEQSSKTINDSVTTLRSSSSQGPPNAEEEKQKQGASASASPENDEFGETGDDVEVGAMESGSLDNPTGIGNTAAGDIDIDQVQTKGKSKKSKDSRSMKLFKVALADFVKEVLKPSWRQGNMSKEAFKTIVKKTVDKVSGAMKNHQIPKSQAKINQYVESSQRKLTKLVMGYVDKYVKS